MHTLLDGHKQRRLTVKTRDVYLEVDVRYLCLIQDTSARSTTSWSGSLDSLPGLQTFTRLCTHAMAAARSIQSQHKPHNTRTYTHIIVVQTTFESVAGPNMQASDAFHALLKNSARIHASEGCKRRVDYYNKNIVHVLVNGTTSK